MDRKFENGECQAYKPTTMVAAINWQEVFIEEQSGDSDFESILERHSIFGGGGNSISQEVTAPQVDTQQVDIVGLILEEFERETFGTPEARIEMAQIRVMERLRQTPIVGA